MKSGSNRKGKSMKTKSGPWTKAEISKLKTELKNGATHASVAEMLNRSHSSIQQKAHHMGWTNGALTKMQNKPPVAKHKFVAKFHDADGPGRLVHKEHVPVAAAPAPKETPSPLELAVMKLARFASIMLVDQIRIDVAQKTFKIEKTVVVNKSGTF